MKAFWIIDGNYYNITLAIHEIKRLYKKFQISFLLVNVKLLYCNSFINVTLTFSQLLKQFKTHNWSLVNENIW